MIVTNVPFYIGSMCPNGDGRGHLFVELERIPEPEEDSSKDHCYHEDSETC